MPQHSCLFFWGGVGICLPRSARRRAARRRAPRRGSGGAPLGSPRQLRGCCSALCAPAFCAVWGLGLGGGLRIHTAGCKEILGGSVWISVGTTLFHGVTTLFHSVVERCAHWFFIFGFLFVICCVLCVVCCCIVCWVLFVVCPLFLVVVVFCLRFVVCFYFFLWLVVSGLWWCVVCGLWSVIQGVGSSV